MHNLPFDFDPTHGLTVNPTRALRSLSGSRLVSQGGKLATLIQMAIVLNDCYTQVQTWRRQWRDAHSYTIRVASTDGLYARIHEWVLDRMPESDRRSMSAMSGWKRQEVMADDEPDTPGILPHPEPEIIYRYDGRRDVDLVIGGHEINVYIDRDEYERGDNNGWLRSRTENVVFTARDQAGQRAVMALLDEIWSKQTRKGGPRLPNVFCADPYEGWILSRTMKPRDPKTVVLATGQMERLLADLQQFLADEAIYDEFCQPWHRGFLLHGPPGSGKSSTAMALAYALGLDLYYLALNDVKSDTKLAELARDVGSRSILLIEDVDVCHAAKDHADAERVSAEGLLNVLDGAITPNGQIVIMTTNYKQDLHPSLLRSGRCDVDEEIGYLTDEQLGRLVVQLTGKSGPLPSLDGRQMVAAEITGVVKQHFRDRDAAHAAVVAYLKEDSDEASRAEADAA